MEEDIQAGDQSEQPQAADIGQAFVDQFTTPRAIKAYPALGAIHDTDLFTGAPKNFSGDAAIDDYAEHVRGLYEKRLKDLGLEKHAEDTAPRVQEAVRHRTQAHVVSTMADQQLARKSRLSMDYLLPRVAPFSGMVKDVSGALELGEATKQIESRQGNSYHYTQLAKSLADQKDEEDKSLGGKITDVASSAPVTVAEWVMSGGTAAPAKGLAQMGTKAWLAEAAKAGLKTIVKQAPLMPVRVAAEVAKQTAAKPEFTDQGIKAKVGENTVSAIGQAVAGDLVERGVFGALDPFQTKLLPHEVASVKQAAGSIMGKTISLIAAGEINQDARKALNDLAGTGQAQGGAAYRLANAKNGTERLHIARDLVAEFGGFAVFEAAMHLHGAKKQGKVGDAEAAKIEAGLPADLASTITQAAANKQKATAVQPTAEPQPPPPGENSSPAAPAQPQAAPQARPPEAPPGPPAAPGGAEAAQPVPAAPQGQPGALAEPATPKVETFDREGKGTAVLKDLTGWEFSHVNEHGMAVMERPGEKGGKERLYVQLEDVPKVEVPEPAAAATTPPASPVPQGQTAGLHERIESVLKKSAERQRRLEEPHDEGERGFGNLGRADVGGSYVDRIQAELQKGKSQRKSSLAEQVAELAFTQLGYTSNADVRRAMEVGQAVQDHLRENPGGNVGALAREAIARHLPSKLPPEPPKVGARPAEAQAPAAPPAAPPEPPKVGPQTGVRAPEAASPTFAEHQKDLPAEHQKAVEGRVHELMGQGQPRAAAEQQAMAETAHLRVGEEMKGAFPEAEFKDRGEWGEWEAKLGTKVLYVGPDEGPAAVRIDFEDTSKAGVQKGLQVGSTDFMRHLKDLAGRLKEKGMGIEFRAIDSNRPGGTEGVRTTRADLYGRILAKAGFEQVEGPNSQGYYKWQPRAEPTAEGSAVAGQAGKNPQVEPPPEVAKTKVGARPVTAEGQSVLDAAWKDLPRSKQKKLDPARFAAEEAARARGEKVAGAGTSRKVSSDLDPYDDSLTADIERSSLTDTQKKLLHLSRPVSGERAEAETEGVKEELLAGKEEAIGHLIGAGNVGNQTANSLRVIQEKTGLLNRNGKPAGAESVKKAIAAAWKKFKAEMPHWNKTVEGTEPGSMAAAHSEARRSADLVASAEMAADAHEAELKQRQLDMDKDAERIAKVKAEEQGAETQKVLEELLKQQRKAAEEHQRNVEAIGKAGVDPAPPRAGFASLVQKRLAARKSQGPDRSAPEAPGPAAESTPAPEAAGPVAAAPNAVHEAEGNLHSLGFDPSIIDEIRTTNQDAIERAASPKKSASNSGWHLLDQYLQGKELDEQAPIKKYFQALIAAERAKPPGAEISPPAAESPGFGRPVSAEEQRVIPKGGQEDAGAVQLPKKLTSLANEQADQERRSRQLPPIMAEARQTNPEVWDRAMATLDADPQAAARLVEELADKPRATTVDENALLLHRKIALANEHWRSMLDYIRMNGKERASYSALDFAAAEKREEGLLKQIDQLDQVTKRTGTEWGRAGQFRRQLAAEDYSLASMLLRTEAAKKGELSAEEKVAIGARFQKIRDAQAAFDAAKVKADEALKALTGQPSTGIGAKAAALPEYKAMSQAEEVLARAKSEQTQMEEAFKAQSRSRWDKALDYLFKTRVAFVISSLKTFAKIAATSATRFPEATIGEATGAALSRLPGVAKIAAAAPSEGRGLTWATEKASYAGGLLQGFKDAWATLRTGKSALDVIHGGSDVPQSWLDWIGVSHAAAKAPAVRAAYTRSFLQRIDAAAAQGKPLTAEALLKHGTEAYIDSQRAKFQQDNAVVSYIRKLEEGAIKSPNPAIQAAGIGAKLLTPVLKIPTNLIAETLQYTFGAASGSAQATPLIWRGVKNLSPKDADSIMRQLKKGSVGVAMLGLGMLNPDMFGGFYQKDDKRKKGDVQFGEARIGGLTIPSWAQHNPMLEVLHVGATIRRAWNDTRKGHERNFAESSLAALGGLAEELPFVREQTEIRKAFASPHEQGQFFGETAKAFAVPQLFQWWAGQQDQDVEGHAARVDPKTPWQYVKSGLPWLRQDLPLKKQAPPRLVGAR